MTSTDDDQAMQVHDSAAERSVIGAVLLGGRDVYLDVADLLQPADFLGVTARAVWRACAGLVAAQTPIDPVTVHAWIRDHERSRQVDLVELLEIVEDAPGTRNVRAYAAIVRSWRDTRDAINAMRDGLDMVLKRQPDAIAKAQSLVLALGAERARGGAVDMTDALRGWLAQQDARETGHLAGVSTGIKALDERWGGGMGDGDLVVIAARPAMGKTALAMQIASHVAESIGDAGPAAMVFSLEMGTPQLMDRELARRARVHLMPMRTGKLGAEMAKVTAAARTVQRLPLLIDDSAPLSIDELCARVRRTHLQRGVRLVVVDYLQLIDGEGDNENARLTGISRSLKLLAKEIGCPVVALSQLNRGVEERPNKRPRMSDLRGSGAIEQDADVVLMIYRDEVYNEQTREKGIAELLSEKVRMGEKGVDRVSARLHMALFEPLSSTYAPPVEAYEEDTL